VSVVVAIMVIPVLIGMPKTRISVPSLAVFVPGALPRYVYVMLPAPGLLAVPRSNSNRRHLPAAPRVRMEGL